MTTPDIVTAIVAALALLVSLVRTFAYSDEFAMLREENRDLQHEIDALRCRVDGNWIASENRRRVFDFGGRN